MAAPQWRTRPNGRNVMAMRGGNEINSGERTAHSERNDNFDLMSLSVPEALEMSVRSLHWPQGRTVAALDDGDDEDGGGS
jgi:hypothetical protein